MGKVKSQSGSVHLIMIFVLVLAVMGWLGYVYWNNSKIETAKDIPKPVNISDSEILSEAASDQTFGTGISFKYPESWTIENSRFTSEYAPYLKDDKTTVTSPDGKISVIFDIFSKGVSGQEGPVPSLKLLQLNTDTVANYPTTRFVSYIQSSVYKDISDEVSYVHYAGLQNNDEGARLVKVGDAADGSIFPPFSNWILLKTLDNSIYVYLRMYINIFNYLTQNEPVVFKNPTVNDINEAFETDSYKVAKQIIQSLYIAE